MPTFTRKERPFSETIERLAYRRYTSPPGSFEYFLEGPVFDSPAAQQRPDKLHWQMTAVGEVLVRGGSYSIPSLGCGGGTDLADIEPQPAATAHVILNDTDTDALALASSLAWYPLRTRAYKSSREMFLNLNRHMITSVRLPCQ
jgi:hypothetical protein